jgi:peptidoglycan L-alanyl-D-glutamate endopeptidase CwlK
MSFSLGKGSRAQLVGVDPVLTHVSERAIVLSPVDFAVHDGLRTLAEQREYVATGVSKTMQSYHLPQAHDGLGKAVDLVPYINGKFRWEWPAIYKVSAAVHQAANEIGVLLRWGAIWDRVFNDLDPAKLSAEVKAYADRNAGPDFLDGPHFEVYDKHHHRWGRIIRPLRPAA